MTGGAGRVLEYARTARALGSSPSARWMLFWKQTKNLRVRFGVAAHHPERVYRLDTQFGPLFFRDNFGDVTNLPSVLFRNVYRARSLTRAGAVVDVGANIGLAAAAFARFNPGRAIHCVEPLSSNATLIARNCPGATVDVCAAGAAAGTIVLRVDPDDVIASSIECRWDTRDVHIPVRPLDEILRSRGVGPVALLKIDAEGMEPEILQGGKETLSRTAEVAIETHGRAGHDETCARLRDAGFRLLETSFNGATGFVVAER